MRRLPARCLVIGDLINDVVVYPREAFARGSDTSSRIEASPGGSGANQAAWMAALGGSVRFVGRAGAGDASVHRAALESLGIDARIAIDEQRPTGTIVVLVTGDGERSMFTDRGASAALCETDLPYDLLSGVSVLHVSGYALFADESRGAVGRLWRAAQAESIARTVDPASCAGLKKLGTEAFLSLSAGADVIFPNLDEGRLITGATDPGQVADALVESYPLVVLKLGDEGVLTASRKGLRLRLKRPGREPAGEGGQAVLDSTGAGDAFLGGFLAALLGGPSSTGEGAPSPGEAHRREELEVGELEVGELEVGEPFSIGQLCDAEIEHATRAGLDAATGAVHKLGARPPAWRTPRRGSR
ncbi:MAG: carbohydrate kinase family protein [Acidimicrobiales bacterium]